MRKLYWAIAGIIFLTLVTPLTSAHEDALKVVLTVPEIEYWINSTVHFTVHVFHKGTRTDPDHDPWVYMGWGNDAYNITVTRNGPGSFKGEVRLTKDIVNDGQFEITAEATFGKSGPEDESYDQASATIYLMVEDGGLKVDCGLVSLPGSVVRPGVHAVFRASVTNNGVLIDPEEISFNARFTDDEMKKTNYEFNHTRGSLGVYEGTFVIPEVSSAGFFTIRAEVRADVTAAGSALLIYTPFFVGYHSLEKTVRKSPTQLETHFELFVADLDGRPVKGAEFDIVSGSMDQSKVEGIEPTDEEGKTVVIVPFGTGRVIPVKGTIRANGLVQSVSGNIFFELPSNLKPAPPKEVVPRPFYGFQTLLTGAYGGETYEPGTKVTRKYYVFNDTEVWGDKEVYVYIIGGTKDSGSRIIPSVVEGRKMTTEPNGRLNVTIDTDMDVPLRYTIEIFSATDSHSYSSYMGEHNSSDGYKYEYDTDRFETAFSTYDLNIDMEVGPIGSGKATSVRTDAEEGDPSCAEITWQIPIDSVDYEWAIWSVPTTYIIREGGAYNGSLMVPSFLPGDSKIVLIANIESPSGSRTGFYTKEGGPDEGDDDGGFMGSSWAVCGCCGASAIVLLAIASVITFVIVRKRSKGASSQVPVEGTPKEQEAEIPKEE